MTIDTQVAPKAQTYRLKTALLRTGRTHRVIASTGTPEHAMNIAIKCYAEGGENAFHSHAGEDHTFIVLAGRAIFHEPDVESKLLGRNEGILIPAGALYKFEAVPGEPLVLLRVGNQYKPLEGSAEVVASDRVAPDGSQLLGNSKENLHVAGVPIPGAFYE